VNQVPVAVVGRLFCKSNLTQKPFPVLLYDRDLGDPDDLMGQSNSELHGSFYVEGYETEISNIDPEIRIKHDCRGKDECLKVEIPDDYISTGIHPHKIYDAGTIHLDKHEPNC
jgi:hypothetical protein